ncbi:MAG: rhodanese-like domain-containing protein [Desulfuromonadales bacterium]|nr:rhodanese-like domain-containing protein [Desulfuromonadales bacterium]
MSVHRLCLLLLCCTLLPMAALAADPYNYISAAALEARLIAKEPTHLVDIQVEEEFARHHITGATATFAYPVKSDADRAKLEAVLSKLKSDSAPVVVVCPRGAGGATRTYEYLLSQGIAAERLLILEKGQEGWACAALTEGK